jgi:hypothetical protein
VIQIILFITPALTLPHRGGGPIFDFLQDPQNYSKKPDKDLKGLLPIEWMLGEDFELPGSTPAGRELAGPRAASRPRPDILRQRFFHRVASEMNGVVPV